MVVCAVQLQIEVASLADSELLRCYKENFLSPHRLLVFDVVHER